ncbi:MAG TPA: TonB-dependent receptor [Steroidobacter sp.]|uniref:TonB-dependent receptor n=1 Tax=Steroidobacter sp. TaxID=1978227 RepID=UPI002ED78219
MRRRGSKQLAGGLLTLALAVSTALAQQKVAFDIPAQPASAAIQTWARASGLQVFAAEEHLQGIKTNPVHGDYTPIEAMQLMVQGTGLEVVASSENTVTIRRANPRDMPGTPPDERFNAGQLMEVVVTGSRIKRAGFDTLQTGLVTNSQQIERRGYTNVAEALNALPTFGSSGADTVGTTQDTHGVGQTFVDLFNLGSQRTLVLVNGRRYVTSKAPTIGGAAGAQVDLNTIPVGLVDRVEVVSIGGAPVYGSDAIAGTVNIILKKDYEGFDASAQYGDTEHGGGESKTFRALMGGNFMQDRGNIAVGVEYTETEGLLYSDRFAEFYSHLPNAADTGPNDGIPAQVVGTLRYPFLTEGGLPHANTLAPALGGGLPGLVFPPFFTRPNYIYDSQGRPLHFGANGELIPFNVGTVIDDSGGLLPTLASGGDGMNPAEHFSLLSPTQRTLINAIGHFDINDHVRAIFELSYANTRGRELSELYSFVAPGLLGGPRLTFSVNNPFLGQQARDTLIANLGADATFDLNRNLNDLTDRRGGRTAVDLYRMVGGFEGAFDAWGERLSWDVSFNYGRSRGVSELTYINPDRLLQAIDVTVTPSGEIVCSDPSNDCAPLNLFGVNNFSQDALDFVSDPATGITVNTQRVATANVGGNLPFGVAAPIAFNLGYEYREETGSFSPDSAFRAGNIILGPPGEIGASFPISGGFDTNEVYTELVVPMIDDSSQVPIIKSASLEGAVRYVDHSLTGGATTWSTGGRIAPRLPGWGDGVMFRGVYTEAIRSPAITELFTNTPVTESFDDPCDSRAITSGPNPSARAANCAAALGAAGVANPAAFDTRSTTGLISPSGSQVGNPDLNNEIAESWSVGIVFQPVAWPNFRMAIDWTDIKLEGGIQVIGIERRVQNCYDSNTFPNTACDGFTRYTAADIAALPPTFPARQVGDLANGFEQTYVNLSTIDFEGLIVSTESAFEAGPGSLSVGTTVFYTARFEETVFAGDEPVDQAGLRGVPEYSVQFNLGYRWKRLDVDWQTLWKSAVDVGVDIDPELLAASRIPSYALHNVTFGYQINDAMRAQLGAVNVLDEEVPLNALPNGFSGYDPIGRRYFLTLFTHF